jgi:small GTP-binding protein
MLDAIEIDNDNDIGENKEPDTNNNRYTKIGNILQEYIDEGENEQNNANENKTSTDGENKNASITKKINKYKIILVGEPGVGKTSIINKYVFNKFESSPIIKDEENSEKNIKMIDIDDKISVELSIYDTTNAKKMSKIPKSYFRDAHGAVIIFDVSNKESFAKVKYWEKEINNNSPKDIIICILGNKSDLPGGRTIDIGEAKQKAGNNLCYEVSAKVGNNISLAFEQLAFRIIKEQQRRKEANDVVIRGNEGRKSINLAEVNVKKKDKKKKCC